MTNYSEAEIRKIVEAVVRSTQCTVSDDTYTSTTYKGRRLIGIYSDMNEAIDAAEQGYFAVRAMSVEQREKLITEIRRPSPPLSVPRLP